MSACILFADICGFIGIKMERKRIELTGATLVFIFIFMEAETNTEVQKQIRNQTLPEADTDRIR
jgi:hypothetical protein